MTKFKVGDKVRILDVKSIDYGSKFWQNGDITKVTRIKAERGVYLATPCSSDEGLYVTKTELDYIEKLPQTPTKNQRITTLESEVAELKAKVEALENAQSTTKPAYSGAGTVFFTGKPIGKIDAIAALSKSPNEQRKEIIAKAKVFVAENLTKNHPSATKAGVWFTSKGGYFVTDKSEFVINAKKRTVVALIRDVRTNEVMVKAIAKCAPDDVFNADIGKAIALGRALGLDVSRFEQAVKPTGPKIGQIYRYQFMDRDETQIITAVGGDFAKFKHISDGHTGQHELERFKKDSTCAGYPVGLTLLDDTEAQY